MVSQPCRDKGLLTCPYQAAAGCPTRCLSIITAGACHGERSSPFPSIGYTSWLVSPTGWAAQHPPTTPTAPRLGLPIPPPHKYRMTAGAEPRVLLCCQREIYSYSAHGAYWSLSAAQLFFSLSCLATDAKPKDAAISHTIR